MSTYLLLRDNKQSGPYSLSEIQTKGFKKYDLVWIEGKSAAWRYPGEIAELKSFAPIIEEQPYDRFFKKPSEQNKETNTLRQEPIRKQAATTVVTANQVVVELGDKKVYAALPAKKNNPTLQPQIILTKPATSIKEEIKKPIAEPFANTYFQEKEPEQIQQQNIYQPKEKYSAKKNQQDYRRYLQPLVLAFCIIALLGAGIFIGMSISKNSSTNIASDQIEKQVAKIDKQEPQNVSIPISTTAPMEDKTVASNKGNEISNANKNSLLASEANNGERKDQSNSEYKKANKLKFAAIPEPTKIAAQRENIITDSSNGAVTRQATHRTDAAVNDKDLMKNSIGSLVSISANKYNVGTFGGISELQLTVNNKSTYPLDLVMVEIQYVQANKKIYKTENIYYRNVRPGEAMMQEAPKSSRGVKVEYKVTAINSKESSVSYSGI